MKIISLNESQFNRLLEDIENYGENSTPEKQGNDEVSLTAKISDKNGEIKNSTPLNTDKFADMQSPQQWGSVGGRKSSNTI